MKRKLIAALVAAAVLFCLPGTALAAVVEHDLSTGSLEITQENANADGYHVYQSNAETPTSNVISVGAGVVTHIVLDNVNIKSGEEESGIDVADGADVTLELKGENSVGNSGFSNQAGVHVAGGSLTIEGDGSLRIGCEQPNGSVGAAIGSNADEDFSGSIAIGGNARVKAGTEYYGAGIGAGYNGDVTETGRITIDDHAQVTAVGGEGAGIGAAYDGTMAGDIHITGSARVTAGNGFYGAGIGTGDYGRIASTGRILIDGNATVIASGDGEGTGIGTGVDGEMAGTITIGGRARVTVYAGDSAAAIGADNKGDMTGVIKILDGAVVLTGVKDSDGNVIEGKLGIIGGGRNFTTEDPNGTYVLSPYAAINGISAGDLQTLLDAEFINIYIDKEGNVVNLTILEKEERGEGERYIWNEARTICAGPLPARAQEIVDAALAKDSADYRILTKDAEGEIYRAFEMGFAGSYYGEDFPVFIHLGSENAGRTVELRGLDGDQLVSLEAAANEDGIAEFLIPKMGSFALILK